MASILNNKLLDQINQYYKSKFDQHGKSPQGVDWNGEESQLLRFHQFLDLFSNGERFSIIDLGCGYGALYDFLSKEGFKFEYHGYDLVNGMIEKATESNKASNAKFTVGSAIEGSADYCVASGILNVKSETDHKEWFDFCIATIDQMNKHSSRGFGFNMLTSYSDEDFMKPHLYYADPRVFFDYCCANFSRSVILKHGYGLYEFTILVNKDGILPKDAKSHFK